MWAFAVLFQMAFFSLVLATPQAEVIPNKRLNACAPAPVIKRDDYTYTPGIGGHKFHTKAATWNEARRTCEEESGHLAIINSIAESNVISAIYNKSGVIFGATGGSHWAFIGFHDLYQEGEYVTIHSDSLTMSGFTQWVDGEPSTTYNGVEENCGSVHKNGGLNDISCDTKCGFICEQPIC